MTGEKRTPLSAAERLRAIADAIEGGKSLTEVAVQFRLPIRALQRVVRVKRNLSRPSSVVSAEALGTSARLIGEGYTFGQVASALRVKVSTLNAVMLKHGLRAKDLRPAGE